MPVLIAHSAAASGENFTEQDQKVLHISVTLLSYICMLLMAKFQQIFLFLNLSGSSCSVSSSPRGQAAQGDEEQHKNLNNFSTCSRSFASPHRLRDLWYSYRTAAAAACLKIGRLDRCSPVAACLSLLTFICLWSLSCWGTEAWKRLAGGSRDSFHLPVSLHPSLPSLKLGALLSALQQQQPPLHQHYVNM